MSFSEEEINYLQSQRLARIATVSADGQPDVAPVGFEFDGTYVYEREGRFGPGSYMRITPAISWSFNLDGRPFTHDREVAVRRTVH